MIGYWRRRRAANRAAQRALASRQRLLAEAEDQQRRWLRRAPWLLPLTLLAGYWLGGAKPGQQLRQLLRGLLRVARWLQRGGTLSLAHRDAVRATADTTDAAARSIAAGSDQSAASSATVAPSAEQPATAQSARF